MSDIKRLVYSPKAYVFIYSRTDGSVVDVSNDVVGGSIERVLNAPSKASIRLKNDDWQYTGRFNPKFLPMDGITIWLQKFRDNPIQVFTGFIDSVPYFQAYPGEIEIKSSCTLKRLLYSYYDPGVAFVNWLATKGWMGQGSGENYTSVWNPMALGETLMDSSGTGNDGGMGQLLHDFLYEIAGLSPSEIIVGDIPQNLPRAMAQAYLKRVRESRAAENSLIPLIKNFVSANVNMTAEDAAASLASKFPTGLAATTKLGDIQQIVTALEKASFPNKPSIAQVLLAALVMSGIDKAYDGTDKRYPSYGTGLFADPSSAAYNNKNKPDVRKQVEEFCRNFNRLVTSAVVAPTRPTFEAQAEITDIMATQVAQTLAYGYDKNRFYSQILEACLKNVKTISQVLNIVRTNQSFDNVRYLDILTASEVAENVNNSEVTWDALFPDDEATDTAKVTALQADGKVKGKNDKVTVGVNEFYSSPLLVYKPSSGSLPKSVLPSVKNMALKYSDIEYYMFSMSSGTSYKFSGDSDLKAGTIVELRNPKDKTKSCLALYLGLMSVYSPAGKSMDDKAPLTLSPAAAELLGYSGENFSVISKPDIIWSPTDVSMPYAGTLEDPNPEIRKEYIKELKAILGSVPAPQTTPIPGSINSDDIKAYKSFYKGSDNRLAQYYYIASNYDLHLVGDIKPKENQLLLREGRGGNGNNLLKFLIHTGMISNTSTVNDIVINNNPQSLPKQIVFGFSNNYYTISYKNGTSSFVRTPQKISDPGTPLVFQKYLPSISIVASSKDKDPKPVWDGETVRLPQSLADNFPATGPGADVTATWSNLAMIATASAFTTITNMPTDMMGAMVLVGDKSLMNDLPVMNAVMELSKGSMREFMSLPNGMFCAFYPDRFGVFGRKPYIKIDDVEIIDFNIVIDDGPLVTHMYVNGNILDPIAGGDELENKVLSTGVVTIDDIFQQNDGKYVYNAASVTGVADEIKNIDLHNEISDALKSTISNEYTQYFQDVSPNTERFFEIYGPRPKVDNDPLIRSPWFEFVSAYNQFAYNWSMHTATNVELSFMPEIMVGGLVEFPQHDIIMYVEAVNHRWDYSTGFETTAYLSSPSTKRGKDPVPGMVLFNGLA